MSATLVQRKSGAWVPSGSANTTTWTTPPVSGHALVAVLFGGANGAGTISSSGWTLLERDITSDLYSLAIYGKTAGASESSSVTSPTVANARLIHLFEFDGTIDVHDIAIDTSLTQLNAPSQTPSTAGLVVMAAVGHNQTYVGTPTITPVSPMANGVTLKDSPGRTIAWSGYGTSDGTAYAPAVNVGAPAMQVAAVVAAVFIASPVDLTPVADFEADVLSGVPPTTVIFTDTSTNSPTSWAWDFGDGSTSTSQDPSHTYTVAGTYTVTLTATNASGSDSETKTAYIHVAEDVGFVDPLPANALIEIYAAEAGAARWDVATWDDDVWSTAGWQDVTPQSVEATIVWGPSAIQYGILTWPKAGSWEIVFYDPERILDPANGESPYFGDLVPDLPVRVTHRNIVIRQGFAEAIGHDFENDAGRMRVYDSIAILANADVPGDTSLPNTLHARAVAAISAAGLGDSITVLPAPSSGDPTVAAWVSDANEWSAWDWIQDAAEQVLHVAYVDRIGRVGFRPWASPLARARELNATELVGLASVIDYDGLYSQVSALDSVTLTMETRALTPPPGYGIRTLERSTPTIDAEDYAAAVLADRAVPSVRWVPGTIYPLTAADVEDLATIESTELVGLVHGYTDPEVLANLIILGGEIRITAKANDEAKWWFTFYGAQMPVLPLSTEDGTAFLMNETETEYLYPDV